jgi:hypothetical protein
MAGFLVIASAKRIRDAGIEMPPALKATCFFWGVLGIVADSIYNGLVGTVRHRALPHWLKWHGIPVAPELYSARIQRLVNVGDPKALRWAAIMNAADPQHIRVPE